MLRDDADYLDLEAANVAGVMVIEQGTDFVLARLGAWRNLHPSLQRRTLRRLAAIVLGDAQDIGEDHIERLRSYLLDPGPNALDQLPRGLRARVDNNTLHLWLGEVGEPEEFPEATLTVPGRVAVPGGEIVSEVWDEPNEDQKKAIVVAGPMHALVDAAAIGSTLTVRSRRPETESGPSAGAVHELFRISLSTARFHGQRGIPSRSCYREIGSSGSRASRLIGDSPRPAQTARLFTLS